MNSFRDPKFVERYEDVAFELETAITAPVGAALQKKTGYRFIVDNTNEVAPFDWYNARFEVDFKVTLTDGTAIAVDDHNGIVNGSHSFIKALSVNVNSKQVYDNTNANHSANIKSLLEYDESFVKSAGTNQFYYLDTSRSAEERQAQATYNKGFAERKALLGTSTTVNTEIPLNKYSFFEGLENNLLPNTKVQIYVTLESDANLIWQAGAGCKVVITKFKLWVPKINFSPEGEKLYMAKYLKPYKWTYLREMDARGASTTEQTGTFAISTGVSRPRHVFVWMSNDANEDVQTANPFLYNTFSVANARTLESCQLIVGNDNKYPDNEYAPSTEATRVYRDVLKYVHRVNDFNGGALLNRTNYGTLFPFIYFNLENQKQDIKDGNTKIQFKYKLSGAANAAYSVYALVLHEQDVELIQSKDGKLLFKA